MSDDKSSDRALSAQDEDIETRIDAAWSAAADDPESDEAAARFIDVVLAEALICPVWEEADDLEADSDAIAPKMVEVDGRDTLLLFDTEERLAAFVEEPTSFVALPGQSFFEMAAGRGTQIALNLDVAESSTVFDPDSVDAIAALVHDSEEDAALIDPRQLTVAAPGDVSEEVIAALGARLRAAGDAVTEAWLFDMLKQPVSGAAEAGRDRPVLALVGGDGDADAVQTLGRELARLAGARDPGGDGVDIAVFKADDPALERIRAVGFGLRALND